MKFTSRQELAFLVYIIGILQDVATEGKSRFCWTKWINSYKSTEGADLEIFTRVSTLKNKICLRPFAVDYARVDGKPVKAKLSCGFYGCTCRDIYQAPGVKCMDYRVRFLCKCTNENAKENTPGRINDIFMCPNDRPKDIKCSGGSVIKITSAYYGNVWISPCGLGSIRSTCRQESSKIMHKIALVCNSRRKCRIKRPTNGLKDKRCKARNNILHVEYSCEEIARAPDGIHRGKVGETFVDPNCKYKCTFLLINRAICLPICPVRYGFKCPHGSIVRWVNVPDSFAKQCTCRKPACISIASRCKVGDKIYDRGQQFPLGCEEECICLGKNEIKCVPLCPQPRTQCFAGKKIYLHVQQSKYPKCTCEVAKCLEGRDPFFDN